MKRNNKYIRYKTYNKKESKIKRKKNTGDMDNCKSFKGFCYIYIYIYIDEEPSLYYGQAKDTNQFLFVFLQYQSHRTYTQWRSQDLTPGRAKFIYTMHVY